MSAYRADLAATGQFADIHGWTGEAKVSLMAVSVSSRDRRHRLLTLH